MTILASGSGLKETSALFVLAFFNVVASSQIFPLTVIRRQKYHIFVHQAREINYIFLREIFCMVFVGKSLCYFVFSPVD